MGWARAGFSGFELSSNQRGTAQRQARVSKFTNKQYSTIHTLSPRRQCHTLIVASFVELAWPPLADLSSVPGSVDPADLPAKLSLQTPPALRSPSSPP